MPHETPPYAQPHPNDLLVPVAHRDRYFGAALRGEAENVVGAPVGDRNNTLYRAAVALGQLVAAGYGGPNAETQVREELQSAACLAGLDRDPNCGLTGIGATISSGLCRGKTDPRTDGDNGHSVESPAQPVRLATVAESGDVEPGYPAWPYAEIDGRLVLLTRKRCLGGETVLQAKPLADFTARIEEQVTTELGERWYRISGHAIRGGPFEVEIPADVFANDRSLKAALDAAAGARDPVRAGMGAHLAPAIKLLSGDDLIQTRRYARTGWTEDGHFLIPGRALGGVTIRLPRQLPYCLDFKADLASGCQALDSLLGSFAPEPLTVVLAFSFQAPMAMLAGWRNDRYALFISGRTGTLKTSTAQVLMSLYGAGFIQDGALVKWGEGTTRNAAMDLAACLPDLPFLLDNYKPSTGRGTADFVSLVHNLLEGGEKLRLDRTSHPRDSRAILSWPLFTGEDVPDQDPAALARVLIVRFDWACGEPHPGLTVAQGLASHLVSIGRQWIEWLESSEGTTVAREAGIRSLDHRGEWVSYLKQLRPDMVNILRVSANLASNEAVWWAMTQHPVIGQIIQRYTDAHHRGLLDVAQGMAQYTSSAMEATRFLAAVRQLYASGRLFLLPDRSVRYPRDSAEQSRFVGWADDHGGAFVLPDMLREKIARLLGPDALGYLSNNALYAQLRALDMLASTDEGRSTRVIRVCDDLVRVLHLAAAALREPADPSIDIG